MQHFCRLAVLAGIILLGPQDASRPSAEPPGAALANAGHSREVAVPALIQLYCAGCHSNGRAGVDLDGPVDERTLRRDRAAWEKVLHNLRTGHMPPKGQPKPSPEERAHLSRWLEQGLSIATDQGPLMVRRLLRTEYINSIRALLAVSFQPAADFPADDAGWDRCTTVPTLAPDLLAKYRVAAEAVLDLMLFSSASVPGLRPEAERNVSVHGKPETTTQRARRLLAAFARRAFRRTAEPAEVTAVLAHYEAAARKGSSFDVAIKVALKEVLMSPHFLHRVETRVQTSAEAAPSHRTVAHRQYELAARLSYFLWSSPPDDELLTQARRGVLHQDLPGQVRRSACAIPAPTPS